MFKKILTTISLIALSVNLCGCVVLLAGAAGGAGTAYWLSEKLTQDFNAPYDRTIKATLDALETLKMPVDKQTTTGDVTQIISKDNQSRMVWIDIKPTTMAATRISVRVGAKGDKTAAQKILTKISAYL
jgi:hypothetical protein